MKLKTLKTILANLEPAACDRNDRDAQIAFEEVEKEIKDMDKYFYPTRRRAMLNVQFSTDRSGTPRLEIVWNEAKKGEESNINSSMLFMLKGLLNKNNYDEPQLEVLKCFAKTIIEHEDYLFSPKK